MKTFYIGWRKTMKTKISVEELSAIKNAMDNEKKQEFLRDTKHSTYFSPVRAAETSRKP